MCLSGGKQETYKDRVITSDIVGTWYSIKTPDSIVHTYTVNGKLTYQRYEDEVLKYTGYFNYDITEDNGEVMEYWGENTDAQTIIKITNKDTLWLQNFLGKNYTFYRIKTN
ncbi:MAG: hypothetical protein Kow0068_15130 [Marinilabiliales bacterium]